MAMQALPVSAKPTSYLLRIEPDFERGIFSGTVKISITTSSAIVSLTLHLSDLNIVSSNLVDSAGNPLAISFITTNRKTQTFKIILENHVPANSKLFLHQTFTGVLRTDGKGFHVPARTMNMVATNLEPTLARSVFPCFDEPGMKATFTICVVAPKNLTCLSNMPVKSVSQVLSNDPKLPTDRYLVEFEETPMMSTYLVAIAVGDFNFLDSGAFRIPVRVYCPAQDYNLEDCKYALSTAQIALQHIEAMLEFAYPLPKFDLLLLPGSTGGMENWGLVTLSPEMMIIATDNTAEERVDSSALIVHEIAHQWFGNLVTMSSWDSYWLKEALAECFELEVRERIFPNLDPFHDWVAGGLQWALFSDSAKFGHALEVKIDGEVIPRPFFDEITYKKGCAVLRMVSGNLGSSIFLDGVRLYLRLHAYGNTDTEDLWNALSHVSGIDVSKFVKPWTETTGHPILTIQENDQESMIKITQSLEEISYQGQFNDQTCRSNALLPIPLQIISRNGTIGDLMNTESRQISIPLDFYSINAGQTGFYRVAYTPSRINKFIQELPKGRLCVEDRIALLSNTAAFAFSGHPYSRTSTLLSLLQSFEDEENFFVWKTIISVLAELRRSLMFENARLRRKFESFWKHTVKKCLYRKGKCTAEDGINEQRFKAMMFGNSAGDEKVEQAAELMFDRFTQMTGKEINPNLRAQVFKIILHKRGKKEYDKLKTRLKSATAAQRSDILSSLGYSSNPGCIKKTIRLAFSDESISRGETIKILRPLVTHRRGIEALWKYLTSGKWMKNPKLTTDDMAPISGMVLASYTKTEQAELARKLLGKMGVEAFDARAEHALALVDMRARWIESDGEDLREWLMRNGYDHTWRAHTKEGLMGLWEDFWMGMREQHENV